MKNGGEEIVTALTAVAALLLVFCVFAPHAQAEEWDSADKFKHYEAGRAISMLATTQMSKPKAFAVGSAVGFAKEFVDTSGYREKDAVVTLAGALAGAYAPGLAIRKRGSVTSIFYTWSF
jgi:hypothetical protein